MRILHVTDLIRPIGGTERAVATLCNVLVAQGHTVAVAHADADSSPLNPSPEQLDLAVERLYAPGLFPSLPSPARFHALPAALAAVEAWRPDVVHLHHMHDPLATKRLSDCFPVFRTHHTVALICPGGQKLKHGPETICTQAFGPLCFLSSVREDCTRTNDGRRMRMRYVTRSLAELTAHRAVNAHIAMNIVSSDYMRTELLRAGYPAPRITVIPLGSTMPSANLSLQPRARGVPRLLFAGRLVRQKGVHILLQAVRDVKQPYELVIAGEGPFRPTLERQVTELQLGDRVSFLGWVDNVSMLIDLAPDAVVVPSLVPETFGLSGVEALAHGIPAIAFAVGAIPEWLSDKETGWLVPPPNVAGLTSAIESAVSVTDGERRAFGARGRAFVRTHHAVADYGAAIIDCYLQYGRRAA